MQLQRRTFLASLLLWVLIAAPASTVRAQDQKTPCTEDAMIVFDGSGSMAEIGYNAIGVPRISEARMAMRRVIPSVAAARRPNKLTDQMHFIQS